MESGNTPRPPSQPPRRGRAIGIRSRGPTRGTSSRGMTRASGPPAVNRARSESSALDQSPPEPSFFTQSDNTQIHGGQFSIARGHHTNLNFIFNQNGYNADEASTPVHHEDGDGDGRGALPTIRTTDSPQHRWFQRRPSLPVQRSCEIYYRQLVVKGRGSPLWVPAPNTQLPLEYRRKGISIGDVGIITDYGGFDFLFSIFDDPNNPDDLTFGPLGPPLQPRDVRGYSDFRPNSYLVSSSIEKSRRGESDPSGLVFESSAQEGAILTMPQGSKSQDLSSIMRFRKHTTDSTDSWYRYAHDVRGLEARNGDLRVVVGWDQTTTWGMATFATTTSQNVPAFRLKFGPRRGRAQAAQDSDGQAVYDWEYESGMAESHAGPDAREIEELRAGEASQDGVIYENQCLFVRTLNVTLEEGAWNKLVSETDMRYIVNDLNSTQPSPTLLPQNYSPIGKDSTGSPWSGQYESRFDGSRLDDSPPSSVVTSELSTALAIHPSKIINERLLKDNPNAKMAIIQDQDWISVMKSDDLVMPSGDELYERILDMYHVREEDGVLFLESKQDENSTPKPKMIQDATLDKILESKDEQLSESEEVTFSPGWAITKYEVDCDEKIGVGNVWDVYSGTWQGRAVAVKVLNKPVPGELLSAAMDIWTTLEHPNILSVYGGSDPNLGDPTFFIMSYMKAGTLVQYLKAMETSMVSGLYNTPFSSPRYRQRTFDDTTRDAALLRAMIEIANGMEYLHGEGVLHGALRASNVLMDDNSTCVISDFGQKDIEDAVSKIPDNPHLSEKHVRWKSPEFISSNVLTEKVDVWAFAITCSEILMMGSLPWPHLDDASVQRLILYEKFQPPHSSNLLSDLTALRHIMHECWKTAPEQRPSFSKIVLDLRSLRKISRSNYGSQSSLLSMSPRVSVRSVKTMALAIPLPASAGQSQELFDTTSMKSLLSVAFFPMEYESEDLGFGTDRLDEDEQDIARIKDERRFRLLLTHQYHPSLTLPLWEPSYVGLGAVGYLQKPAGKFVTLFNAFYPNNSTHAKIRALPSVHAYGEAKIGLHKHNKRSITRRLLDTFSGSSVFGNNPRCSFSLRSGHKAAYMYAEDTEYRYMQTLEASKAWFKANVDAILNVFGRDHNIAKEDIFLVIGTLQTSNYAFFVSHTQGSDATLYFNVSRSLKKGKPWGTFTIDHDEDEKLVPSTSSSKISTWGDDSKAILLSRLRFKPDNLEPTSL